MPGGRREGHDMPGMETGFTCVRPPRAILVLDLLMQVSPWTWIAAVFFVQTAAALGVARMLRLPASEIALPIAILMVGTFVALAFRRMDRGGSVGLWKWWVPPAAYALFIFLLSNRSFSGTEISFNVNWFHPAEYLTLGLLTSWAWYPFFLKRGNVAFASAVLLSGAVFGLFDELHQSLVPGRTMSITDLWLDLTGLTVGFLFFALLRSLNRFHAASCSPR